MRRALAHLLDWVDFLLTGQPEPYEPSPCAARITYSPRRRGDHT